MTVLSKIFRLLDWSIIFYDTQKKVKTAYYILYGNLLNFFSINCVSFDFNSGKEMRFLYLVFLLSIQNPFLVKSVSILFLLAPLLVFQSQSFKYPFVVFGHFHVPILATMKLVVVNIRNAKSAKTVTTERYGHF